MHEIYLDYNATAPPRDEALAVWQRVTADCGANASSAHAAGRRAKDALDAARETLAGTLGARPREIVFTSGGTESDNLAVKGVALARGTGHIVTSAIEHPAVLETCRYLERHGFSASYVAPGADGRVEADAVARAIRADTILVSVMWVNNETGVIQPVEEIAAAARARGVPFHTDAVQACGRVPIDVRGASVDLLSISAHKFGGPKGAGALFVRRGVELEPLLHGGGQEWNARSGTRDVAAAAAMAEAARLAHAEMAAEIPRQAALRDRLERDALARIPRVFVNGGAAPRVGNTSNLRIEDVDGETLLLALDEHGIAASSASACAASHAEPSHVLMAMALTRRQAEDSMRVSLGRLSGAEDVNALLEVLPALVERIRALR
ncbi:MAG: cysteine desulfurase [Candidatus Krumholzibacteria bacterium]|nr:cysteine desulfurase [Candidatus Krumholzibacteria bacterium]